MFRMGLHGASTDVNLSYTFQNLQFLNQIFNTAVKRKVGLHYVLSMKSIVFFEYIRMKLLYYTFVEKFDFFKMIFLAIAEKCLSQNDHQTVTFS